MALTHEELAAIRLRRSQEDLKTLIAHAEETLGPEPEPEVEYGLEADELSAPAEETADEPEGEGEPS